MAERIILDEGPWDDFQDQLSRPAVVKPRLAALLSEDPGLYGSGVHPAGDQYGPADMTVYDQHRSEF